MNTNFFLLFCYPVSEHNSQTRQYTFYCIPPCAKKPLTCLAARGREINYNERSSSPQQLASNQILIMHANYLTLNPKITTLQ
ncbi:hypothetical protein EUGRSUZ_F01095 [Eucalyptus grandis]|uniref:Uncharacterized protein n=4 Tax=Eucalyptus grandis TaxID=71139 RepID=A0A059BM54_EUCGR|nr:hypothetical protein EUGRSUZ_F01095 [Eucalyptus grandis]KAK3424297.1 hypothetical protein EUGRSUZ_F01095 [Eucalyptus grandis]KAK3424298.1 hypothetical protein EUGRSUZ_F01095 [Eucalyptus grandis]